MNVSIIEDSSTIAHLVSTALNAYGFEPLHISSKRAKKGMPNTDLFIINTQLSDLNSVAVIQELKSRQPIPGVVCINSKGTWQDKVRFIRLGADDVLTYPFPMRELTARIQVLASGPRTQIIKVYQAGDLAVDMYKREVVLKDTPITLRQKEFGLLSYMVKNKERPISRSELLDNVWDYRKVNSSNTVDVHVNRLRDKLGNKRAIKTVYGFGYQLDDEYI